jgi:hypothetical protein
VLVSNSTRPGIHGVSVRVLGMGLGLGCSQVACPTRERERGNSLIAGRGGRAVRTSGRECVAPGRGSGVAGRAVRPGAEHGRPEVRLIWGPAHDRAAAEASELASVSGARTGDALAGEIGWVIEL